MAQIPGQEDKEKTTALKDLLSRIDLDELMKKDEPPLTFPKTLEEFEYAFNELAPRWLGLVERSGIGVVWRVTRVNESEG
ncbi:unnamed protein product [Coregonus sp. 'balchen']|nr:unnamed protein product [Coregonus sp. 'balchen']